MIVDLEAFKLPPCLILRRDGGTLYPTRDIAAAIDRRATYGFYKSLYVTDVRQAGHFAQFFKVLELMGYEWAKDLAHVPYGLLSVEGGALSSRKGNTVLLEDLFDEARARVLKIIEEKNPGLPDKEHAAEKIGQGAIIFASLYNNRIKDVDFYWDRILSFDGETGPYVQYAHARCCSVLEKAGATAVYADFSCLNDPASFAAAKTLAAFPAKLIDAADKYEPYIISRHLMLVCAAFNRFYHENPILSAEGGLRAARLALTAAVKTVLETGLKLLGIAAVERM
jgi:arginyl-tRNA synthetase